MLAAFAVYLLLHFGLYVLFFRHQPLFREERTIFRYHAGAALAFTALTAVMLALQPAWERLYESILVISLLGIYSLTFLELWSLAQGSYALSILASVATAERTGGKPNLTALEKIGAAKKVGRLEGLQHLGLVDKDRDRLTLTPRGHKVATALAGLAGFIALKRKG